MPSSLQRVSAALVGGEKCLLRPGCCNLLRSLPLRRAQPSRAYAINGPASFHGHAPVNGGDFHATTILSVRRKGRVVRMLRARADPFGEKDPHASTEGFYCCLPRTGNEERGANAENERRSERPLLLSLRPSLLPINHPNDRIDPNSSNAIFRLLLATAK